MIIHCHRLFQGPELDPSYRRIHGMVERLCRSYGTRIELPITEQGAGSGGSVDDGGKVTSPSLIPSESPSASYLPGSASPVSIAGDAQPDPEKDCNLNDVEISAKRRRKAATPDAPTDAPANKGATASKGSFFTFPTLEQLAKATEEDLRAAGFG